MADQLEALATIEAKLNQAMQRKKPRELVIDI
jgi:hypothetical protein